jgi:ornithine cyclodeaminase/alanine dehydrogenase-like protein (mu-crystallin family)
VGKTALWDQAVRILLDRDIDQVPLEAFFVALRRYLVDDANGNAVSPPRHAIDFPEGKLVFTSGGNRSIAGFRAYHRLANANRIEDSQIVAVWDRLAGTLKGVAIGNRLGALRTGVLGGIAVDILAAPDSAVCGVVGAGKQAETQLLAACSVRDFEEVRVYARNPDKRQEFADRLSARTGRKIFVTGSAREAVSEAAVVLLATNSKEPVVEPEWLLPEAHVTTVGPQFANGHEMPLNIAATATTIASDSPKQIAAQGDSQMLFGTAAWSKIVHLGELAAANDWARRGPTLYLSTGLAGTEVAALDAALTVTGGEN